MVEPLLAIADLAGGEWAKRARKALVALRDDQVEDDEATGVRLLTDIRATWPEGVEELSTRFILENLFEVETSPWADWWAEKETTREGYGEMSITFVKLVPNRAATMKLARMLRPFGARPHKLKTAVKGYRRVDFDDAFARYLPSSDPEVVQVVETAQVSQDSEVSRSFQEPSQNDLEQPVSAQQSQRNDLNDLRVNRGKPYTRVHARGLRPLDRSRRLDPPRGSTEEATRGRAPPKATPRR